MNESQNNMNLVLKTETAHTEESNNSDNCPLCGSELDFQGDQEIVDDSTCTTWECPNCNAHGEQWSNIVFAYHTEVTKGGVNIELTDDQAKCGEVCPCCGGELDYEGDQEIDYETGDTTTVHWSCGKCGAHGTQISSIVFDENVVL